MNDRKFISRWLAFAVLSVFVSSCINDNPDNANSHPDILSAFNYLKQLEGDWEYSDKDGTFGWEFDVTSRGTVIVERLRVGTPTEMTTVYHIDNGILRGNHYCQFKNQPHLTAVTSEAEGDLHFLCDNLVGNTKSHDEIHMHGVHFQKKDSSLLIWMDIQENGKIVLEPRFELTRND